MYEDTPGEALVVDEDERMGIKIPCFYDGCQNNSTRTAPNPENGYMIFVCEQHAEGPPKKIEVKIVHDRGGMGRAYDDFVSDPRFGTEEEFEAFYDAVSHNIVIPFEEYVDTIRDGLKTMRKAIDYAADAELVGELGAYQELERTLGL